MLLSAQNIKKDYGIQNILNINKIEIKEKDRIGLVGRNGAGKSTLFRILSGDLQADEGSVCQKCEIAQILQNAENDGEADGQYVSQMHLKNSAIESGGEKTRLAIASAFSKHAPLLFADEPTTNLDAEGIEKLEKMLKGYRGGIVLISHDRQLLDHVCNTIWELEEGTIRIFPGNYSDWQEQKKREHDFQQFEYEQYQNEKRRITSTISAVAGEAKRVGSPPKRMSSSEWMLYKGIASVQQGHVSNRVSALQSRMEHLEKKERPQELPNISMKLPENGAIKAKNAARISNLTVCFDNYPVLNGVSLLIEAGKKTFLIGENGAGKTTLIRSLLAEEENTFITEDAKIGYFSQEQENLDYDKTVLENVMQASVVPEHIARAVLMNLYMKENDIFKKVSVLSGGERVKTALARVLLSGCNFLILDEPTNHMDIYTMEGLENLLKSYNGTLLAISHDRKFVENMADTVYEVKDGNVCDLTL